MALINCPECNREISDKAVSCPHCGYPLSNNLIEKNEPQDIKEHYLKTLKKQYTVENEIKEALIKEGMDNAVQITVSRFKININEARKYVENLIFQDAELDKLLLPFHPKCPYCGSPKTNKINLGNRLFSAGMFGLGSGKVGKQWHCQNCDSSF